MILLWRPGVQDNQLVAALYAGVQVVGVNLWNVILYLDPFAKVLARHIDAREHLIAGIGPGGQPAVENAQIRIAEGLKPRRALGDQAVIAEIGAEHDGGVPPGRQAVDAKFQAAERQGDGEQQMAVGEYPALARIEQGQFAAGDDQLAQGGGAEHFRHGQS